MQTERGRILIALEIFLNRGPQRYELVGKSGEESVEFFEFRLEILTELRCDLEVLAD